MFLGVLGLFPVFGIAAYVLGKIAITRIDQSEGQLTGRSLAMTGATVGGVFASVAILTVLFLPAINSARRNARQMQNSEQLRGIHQAMVTYAQGNEFWFPGATPEGTVNENAAISNRHGAIMRLQYQSWRNRSVSDQPWSRRQVTTRTRIVRRA